MDIRDFARLDGMGLPGSGIESFIGDVPDDEREYEE
jgi:hypothetical protein